MVGIFFWIWLDIQVGHCERNWAGLRNGLVDVKVCAVNQTWSGLKFVYPLADR
jgi:hypothetical protein